ncbi:hypothetical protein V8B97DRAFT_1983483 [Scleroderma yunnanense]
MALESQSKSIMSQAEDGSLPPGYPLSLVLDGEEHLAPFHVLRSFIPFMKSQVYLVRLDPSMLRLS